MLDFRITSTFGYRLYLNFSRVNLSKWAFTKISEVPIHVCSQKDCSEIFLSPKETFQRSFICDKSIILRYFFRNIEIGNEGLAENSTTQRNSPIQMCFSYSKVCRSVLFMGKYLFKVSQKKGTWCTLFSVFTLKNTLKWNEIQQSFLPTATSANSGGIYKHVKLNKKLIFVKKRKKTLLKWTLTYCYSATDPN